MLLYRRKWKRQKHQGCKFICYLNNVGWENENYIKTLALELLEAECEKGPLMLLVCYRFPQFLWMIRSNVFLYIPLNFLTCSVVVVIFISSTQWQHNIWYFSCDSLNTWKHIYAYTCKHEYAWLFLWLIHVVNYVITQYTNQQLTIVFVSAAEMIEAD